MNFRRNVRGKTILFVIGSLDKGGAESQLAMLASELARKGIAVSVFSLESGGLLRQQIESSGCKVVDGGYHTHGTLPQRMLRLSRAFWTLIRYARDYRPQVLHAYLPLTNFLGSIAGRITGVPLIITARRALGTHQERHPFWPPMDRIANYLSDRVTVNSRAVAEDTTWRDGIKPEKLELIYNGLAIKNFCTDPKQRRATRNILQIDDETTAIITVANLIPYKGHAELLEAFAALAQRHPSIKLFLAGEDRGIQAALERQAVDLSVGERVVFLGRWDNMPELLNGMDLGVLPSHEEGFSNALLEKLAAGLPVVATSVGGNPEALEGMPGCYLCPPRDPFPLQKALELALAGLHGDQENRRIRIQLINQRYSMEKMVQDNLRLYQLD